MTNNSHKKRFDLILILLVAILIISVAAQLIFNKTSKLTPEENNDKNRSQSENIEEIRKAGLNKVVVDFGNGKKIEKNVKADSALKALQEVASGEGIRIETKEYKYGLMVEEINKIKNTNQKYWMYSVNNKPGQIASDRYLITPGDSVEWKYTSAN